MITIRLFEFEVKLSLSSSVQRVSPSCLTSVSRSASSAWTLVLREGLCYVDERLSVHLPSHLQLFQNSQGFLFRCLKALSNDSWMKTLQEENNGNLV